MAKIKIARNVLNGARERSMLSIEERKQLSGLIGSESGKGNVNVDPSVLPMAYLKALLDDVRLTPNQRAVLALQVHGMHGSDVDQQTIYETDVASPVEFGSVWTTLGTATPNCEVFWNGRWYPITVQVQFLKDELSLARSVVLYANLSVCEVHHRLAHRVVPEFFLDDEGNPQDCTVGSIVNQLGLRCVQMSAAEYNLKLVRAERTGRENGRTVLVGGPVMAFNDQAWWSRFESTSLGTPESPRRAIVESELEVDESERGYYAHTGGEGEAVSRLPFVRVFSLDKKRYVFADVDDVAAYQFDENAMSKLHLPEEMLSVLTRVFATPVEDLFGDLIEGKHGGVVILASGNPGVGKTLTAEVYAEQSERPLYVLELGELGTNVSQVEENLSRVFTRVARWNAVLQFDECEIFLTERNEDLERSAIVGIFLRLLDYYNGILFLTTNRPEVLDHAVRSRVMLKLEYPDLDQAARSIIWDKMFGAAGLSLDEGTLEELAESDINGRQIRNLSRLARIQHPQGAVTLDEKRGVLEYGCA